MGALLGLILLAAVPAAALEPRVETDPRLDLMGLVARLSGDPSAARNPFSDAAAKRFARAAKHPAVTGLSAMRATGFTLVTAAQYSVYLSSLPALVQVHPIPDFFAQKAGGRERLEAWRRNLAAFARESGFAEWEAETRAERDSMAGLVRAAQGGRDLAAPLVRLLGVRTWSDWRVAVSAFYPAGGGASWVLEEKEGLPEVFVAYGPYWNRAKSHGGSASDFAVGAWPEAAFTLAYAMSEACRPALLSGGRACRGLKGLPEGEDCYQRHWVHAVVAKLLTEEYGAAAAREYHVQGPATAFDAPIARALAVSAADRARSPDLLMATPLLAAPLRDDRRAPVCLFIDPNRFGERVYARRLLYYLEARLSQRPDAELEPVRAELIYLRGEKK
ncbi:MAG: hypothetical protein ABL955_10955 [Elusimicrobiota bacterium]